jgi:hypothetical protein
MEEMEMAAVTVKIVKVTETVAAVMTMATVTVKMVVAMAKMAEVTEMAAAVITMLFQDPTASEQCTLVTTL